MRRYVTARYLQLSEDAKVLDIGCGTGELLDYLPGKIQYTGFDENYVYIESAKKRYGQRGHFICKNVNLVDEMGLKENEYDAILLFGVMHHLSDDQVSKTLSAAKKMLKEGGYVLSIDGVFLQKQSRIAKYILSNDRGQFVRYDHEYIKLAEDTFTDVEAFVEKNLLRIPTDYLILKMFK
jgi:cyclopropane fatty-acyl-phospholipid synthase-like methyltransferase